MRYIIENIHLLKRQRLKKTSILIEDNRIELLKDKFHSYQYMRMDGSPYIMTPTTVMLDNQVKQMNSSTQQKKYIEENLIKKGCTTFLFYIEVKRERELALQLKKINSQLLNCAIDYVAAVKIPLSLLSPSFVRMCKREKVPVLFIEIEDIKALYQMDGLYEVSEQKLKEAKKILPDEVIIDFALGELYSEQGKIADAIKSYQKVLPMQENIAGVNINGRIADNLSAGGAFEDAIGYYEKALEEKIEINTLFNLALTASQASLYTVAINRFEEVKALDSSYHSLYLYLARAYEHEEMLDDAYKTVLEGIKQDEFNKDLYLYGGKLALKRGDEQKAEEHFREALAIDPEFIDAVLLLNKLFLTQDRFEDVIELIELMDKQEMEEPQLHWDAAKAFHGIEKYSEALNKYQLAYTFFKELPDFLYDYGYFLLEEGKRRDAAEIFNMLLQTDPSNEEYIEILQRLTENE